MRKSLSSLLVCAAILIFAAGCTSNEKRYEDAMVLYDAGLYAEAAEAFDLIAEFQDSADLADATREEIRKGEVYQEAAALFGEEKYTEALAIYESLPGYKDAPALAGEAREMIEKGELYQEAAAFFDSGEYQQALDTYNGLGDYKDASGKAEEVKPLLYDYAIALLDEQKQEAEEIIETEREETDAFYIEMLDLFADDPQEWLSDENIAEEKIAAEARYIYAAQLKRMPPL